MISSHVFQLGYMHRILGEPFELIQRAKDSVTSDFMWKKLSFFEIEENYH